ncbi:MAG: hypothetical protein HY703_09590, partial [Gemmatimonadetes bacterium]|nr:hypothetical protein [Gemmatimonadota bacterium]
PTPGGMLDDVVLAQSLAELVGLDPISRARRALRRALEIEPGFEPAALLLAELALASGDMDALRAARAALETVAAGEPASPNATLRLAHVLRALGELPASEAAADAALAQGADPALALHARATALFLEPNAEERGVEAYRSGIQQLTPAAAQSYYQDLIPIVQAREAADWQRLDLEGRRRWLTRFWEERAALAGVTVAQRVAEHYRRLARAYQLYRRAGRRGAPPGGAVVRQSGAEWELPLDDRGLVYVRHGEPETTIRTVNPELRPNETWVYAQPDGSKQLFHFIQLRLASDFRLVDDVLAALDPTTGGSQLEPLSELAQDLAPYDPRYLGLAAKLGRVSQLRSHGAAANDVRDALVDIRFANQSLTAENRDHALTALARDSDRPRFDRELPFYYDIYTFRGDGTGTDVTAALAIPGDQLEPLELEGETVYSLQLSFIVIDTTSRQSSRVDTTLHFRSQARLERGQYLRTHVQLAAPPSLQAVHRLVVRSAAQPGQGQLYGGVTRIPEYRGPELGVSDIVLAEPDTTGSWHRGQARLALVPPRQFQAGRALTVFYEIYNLPEGTPYRTEIRLAGSGAGAWSRLKRLLGLGGGPTTLRFEGAARPAASGPVQEIRRVASQVGPGRYRLHVVITNLITGEAAARQTDFLVIASRTRLSWSR